MSKFEIRFYVGIIIILLVLLYVTQPEGCNSPRTDMPSICAD